LQDIVIFDSQVAFKEFKINENGTQENSLIIIDEDKIKKLSLDFKWLFTTKGISKELE
jgi:hypothetical protein